MSPNTNAQPASREHLNPLQKLGLGVWAVSTVWYSLYDPAWLWSTAAYIATKTNDILSWTWNIINDTIWSWIETLWMNIPYAGVAAPFAAPMIAWAYLWKKVSDMVWLDKKWQKIASSVVWAWIWGALSLSAAAPYLTWIAAATALWTPFKWTANKFGKTASSVYGGVVWLVGGIVKWWAYWAYYWAKSNWKNWNILPDVGFQRSAKAGHTQTGH